jgi:hypothetical protein
LTLTPHPTDDLLFILGGPGLILHSIDKKRSKETSDGTHEKDDHTGASKIEAGRPHLREYHNSRGRVFVKLLHDL